MHRGQRAGRPAELLQSDGGDRRQEKRCLWEQQDLWRNAENMPEITLLSALERAVTDQTVKLVFSAPRKGSGLRRCTVTRGREAFLVETLTETQAFHRTLKQEELLRFAKEQLESAFTQLHAFDSTHEAAVRVTGKGRILFSRKLCAAPPAAREGHNREKRYLIPAEAAVPALVDMGVVTRDGRVVSSMYDKYRQINRFVEMVEDVTADLPQDRPLTVLDFGCGKSYLTFVLYHYFTQVKGRKVRMVGLDLKKEVIEHCNETARRYGYEGLTFEVGDINGYRFEGRIDLIVTLHACDVATDYALFHAVQNNVPVILSVPCCQHEVNAQIRAEHLTLLTRYGIVKERFSALLTDALRANLLTACGYRTQLLEFIDLAHTPKNLLIRAVKGGVSKETRAKALEEARTCLTEFQVWPSLPRMLAEAGLIDCLAPETENEGTP